MSHVRDRTRFFEGLGTTRPACRYGRNPTLRNDSPNWELFDARGFRVDALEDGEQFHVSMLHVPLGPWQLIEAYSQRDV